MESHDIYQSGRPREVIWGDRKMTVAQQYRYVVTEYCKAHGLPPEKVRGPLFVELDMTLRSTFFMHTADKLRATLRSLQTQSADATE